MKVKVELLLKGGKMKNIRSVSVGLKQPKHNDSTRRDMGGFPNYSIGLNRWYPLYF